MPERHTQHKIEHTANNVDGLIRTLQNSLARLSREDLRDLPQISLSNYTGFIRHLRRKSVLSRQEKKQLMQLSVMGRQRVVQALKSNLTLRGHRL